MANQAHNLSIFNLQIEIAQGLFITIQLTNILKFNHGTTPIFIYITYYYISTLIQKNQHFILSRYNSFLLFLRKRLRREILYDRIKNKIDK